jgi:hypothetical protein
MPEARNQSNDWKLGLELEHTVMYTLHQNIIVAETSLINITNDGIAPLSHDHVSKNLRFNILRGAF